MSGGKKDDTGKADLSLIPLIAEVRAAEAFQVGERKYSRYNYTKGLEASRVMGALKRHAGKWMAGEEFDPVDGQHHLGAVIACAAMLLHMQELGTLIDNRYATVTAPKLTSAQEALKEEASRAQLFEAIRRKSEESIEKEKKFAENADEKWGA